MTPAEKVLLDSWPWLSAEFAKVRLQLEELSVLVLDDKVPLVVKAESLIECGRLVCALMQKAKSRGLFRALHETAGAVLPTQAAQIREEVLLRLNVVLETEESLLVRAGMERTAARLLREDLAALPRSAFLAPPLKSSDFDKKLDDAVASICKRFPKSPAALTYRIVLKHANELKKKYGLVSAITLAAGNLAAVALDPTLTSSALVSKALAAFLAGHTLGGGSSGPAA